MLGSRHFYERGSNQNGKILSQTRGGGSKPQKIQKLPFLGKIFRFQGGVRTPGPPPPLDPRMTLTHFTARSILETEAFTWEKVKTMNFLKNDCSLRPEKW